MADIQGVDVASYQGTPHSGWTAIAPFTWAAVKLTEVSLDSAGVVQVYQDPDASDDWAYLKANGKGRIAYLFAHPNTDPKATVDAFMAMLNGLGFEDTDGVAIDLEVTDGLSPEAVSSWALVTADLLKQATGRTPVLYTFLDFAKAGNCAGLEVCYLWIAATSYPAGSPEVPAPWKDWAIHQYAQSTGPETIDRDVAHWDTVGAMQAAIGQPVYQETKLTHVTTGSESLEDLERVLRCNMSTMLRMTAEAAANGQFTTPLADYINAGNLAAPMPKGITINYQTRIRS